jgi:mono/diheme cytochrome c family protein
MQDRSSTLVVVAALVLAMTSPLATDTWAGTPGAGDAAADGRRLYLEHCAACHGPSGGGDGPNAALFSSKPRNLHDGVLTRYATNDLVQRVRAGRPLDLALDLPALQARARDVEAIVAHMKRLPTVDWGSIDEGWGIYMQRCESCHGRFGRSTASFPPGVRPPRALGEPGFQTSVSDAALIDAIRHGRKGMPAPKPQLTADEVDLVARFIRFLSPGFEIYSQYCAACHGDDGRGAPTLDPSPPTVPFDAAYFARQHPEDLRRSVWHMMDAHQPSMPHLRWTLTDGQARAIIEYLRSTGPSGRGRSESDSSP